MQVEEELTRLAPDKDTLLTIGVFDGVHLGHKYLISQLKEQAKKQGLLSGVVTFYPHPQEVLQPQTRLPWLTDLAERTSLLKNEGIDVVVPLTFTWKLAQLSAREFVNLLQKHLRMRGLLIGPDFALGRQREGNIDVLRELGEAMRFTVTVLPPLTTNGEVVSSTAIRKALADGDIKRVNKLIGRPFSLQGRVIIGTGRGQELGFPTANLEVDQKQAIPSDGVYVTRAYIKGKAHPSVTNIGRKPTFGGNKRTVEVFIFDFQKNLYGRNLKIDIVERLRDEKKFDSAESLKKQIAADVKKAKEILNPGVEAKHG